MNDTLEFLRKTANRLGKPGVIAIGLIIFSTMFYANSLSPARKALSESRLKLERLQAKRTMPEDTRALIKSNPVLRVQNFYRSFPGTENLVPAVNATYSIAGKYGLNLEQAEYQYQFEKGDDLAAYEMSFSLKGPYPKIRNFLLEVLLMNPGLAIDSVSFRREAASSFGVEAKMRLTFFVRSRPWEYIPGAAG